tara:strand:+ start:836 stop:1669 length:834 start_codon:yes stop_codon:yes gene_type:complete
MKNYILIDTSYLIFYRYFALRKWWAFAKKDTPIDQADNSLNSEFYDKFKKVFLDCIKNIKKSLKLTRSNCKVILALDCPRDKIWRNSIYKEYKQSRVYQDNVGNIFKFVYNNNLLYEIGADLVLNHENLEADDIVYLIKKEIDNFNRENLNKEYMVTIITSDRDYLQLSDENTCLLDLRFKNLMSKKDVFSEADKNLFYKIVLGDKSDNIKPIFKKCSKRNVEEYYLNLEKFNSQLKLENCVEEYNINKTLIDFNCIPDNLKQEFIEKYRDIIYNSL